MEIVEVLVQCHEETVKKLLKEAKTAVHVELISTAFVVCRDIRR